MTRSLALLTVAVGGAFLVDCGPKGGSSSSGTSGGSTGSGSSSGGSGALACGGSLTATFANATGASANSGAFSAGEPSVISLLGALTLDANDSTNARSINVTFSVAPSAVGQTFTLVPQSDVGTSGQAVVAYTEGANVSVWVSQGGTLTVQAYSSCFVSFSFDGVPMAPEGMNPDAGGSNGATGTFALSGTGTHIWTPCGQVTGTFSGATGNADTSALDITGPSLDNTGLFSLQGTCASCGFDTRQLQISAAAPVAAGQTLQLTASASPAPGMAAAVYQESVSGDGIVDGCWIADGGSLTVSSLDSCVLSFTIAGANMVPLDGTCDGNVNQAAGSFTMALSGTGDGISQ